MEKCIFCEISKEVIPSSKVYEDEKSYAFLDNKPNNFGHTLLVPKEHSRNIFDMREEVWCDLATPLKKLAIAVKEAAGAKGINITMNNEPEAGQIVFHSHIHIIPRFANDNMSHKLYGDGGELAMAEKIREIIKKNK